jgi:Alw26I/Eco31I/Esp3I family type II restriction m6 adenine DNA methyltransferase
MNHLSLLSELDTDTSERFYTRWTGKYYTHEKIALHMFVGLFDRLARTKTNKLSIIDPFAGDGRLIFWLIEKWHDLKMPSVFWDVHLIDINQVGLKEAASNLERLKLRGIDLNYTIKVGDSFKISKTYQNIFDIVVTNPPWELLKPDKRELDKLNDDKGLYIKFLKKYDHYLSTEYSLSQPLRKFAGWGTNLSRVGAELSFNLIKENGHCAIVLPASFFADDQSINLRKQLLTNTAYEVAYYPAEAKLFGNADVAAVSFLFKRSSDVEKNLKITIFDKDLKIKSSDVVNGHLDEGYTIPITLGGSAIKLLKKMQQNFLSWEQLEKTDNLWAGREIDETGSKNWLSTDGSGPKFIKGKMVDRYKMVEEPSQYINIRKALPVSTNFERIAWRDISRPNQKRRIIATIIPKNTIAGNSLGIAYFKDGDQKSLYSLLAVMNSLCFEFQLRCHLATNHLSLSAIRKVCLPPREVLSRLSNLSGKTSSLLQNQGQNSSELEAIVARDLYKLNKEEFCLLMDAFDKLTKKEKEEILNKFENNE